MTVAACAEIVRRGDPDRFLATMAAPVAARAVLFPIYAFNVEIARAPWVTEEPLIAEMRLQWWADALEEIAGGGAVRAHEVATPLAGVLDAAGARGLLPAVAARRRDCHRQGFDDVAALRAYVMETSGELATVAAGALGAGGIAAVREIGYAQGLANWFRAVPALISRGVGPIPDASGIVDLATDGLARLAVARGQVPAPARPVTRAGWLADRTLRSAAADPAAVTGVSLHIPEFTRRGLLLWRVLTNAS